MAASRREQIKMSANEVTAFLEAERVLNIASISSDGRPHLVPMWYALDGGEVVFWTFAKSQKVVNLRRDPRITALVEAGDTYEELRGVEIVGTARLIEDHDAVVALGTKVARRYGGDLAASADAADMIAQQARKRVGVAIVTDHVVSWDHRKLGGVY